MARMLNERPDMLFEENGHLANILMRSGSEQKKTKLFSARIKMANREKQATTIKIKTKLYL